MAFSLSFNDITTTPTNSYTVQRLSGTGGQTIRVDESNLTGRDGGNVYNRLYGMRTVSAVISIVTTSGDNYWSKRDEIISAWSKDATGNLSITRWGDNPTTRVIPAKIVTEPQFIEESGKITNNSFFVEWRCEDPYFLSETTQSESLSLVNPVGVVVSSVVSAQFGEGSGDNKAIINNTGDVARSPKITFSGALVSPTIRLVSTGQSVGINTTMVAGQTVVIYRLNGALYVELGGTIDSPNSGTSYFRYLSGDLFDIPVGSEQVVFSASSGSGTATIDFTPAFKSL